MATLNPFDLLDGDAEDASQLVAAKPLKVEKAAPVKPADSGHVSLTLLELYFMDSRNQDGPRNENGYGGGHRPPSGEGDGARRGGSVGGYRGGGRGGSRGGSSNGESGEFERPRRTFNRHSGTGQRNDFKRDGGGLGNWGTTEDDVPVTEESTAVADKNLAVEKQGGEDESTDAKKESPSKEQAKKEPEPVTFTLQEYEKVLEEKKKALEVTKVEERKVDTKEFESMQQLSSKKSNNDEVFIKLGTEKDKRTVEKEEKAKKSLSINEFLKLYKPRGGYRGGYRGGRDPRGGAAPGGPTRGGPSRGGAAPGGPSRGGAAPGGEAPGGEGNQSYERVAAPAIEDTAQFPTLGK
ncbi:unnamed protein product [Arabis nemorensis]|uniref:Hyaluronan/mRNA-binding protein domain-containing protein n=1 Tax=Arabis nemorensis TaxID=586526 RepID=A0A565CHL4_9BRAS|nr:unnamed protein product [Arabis nemorensis]